MAKVTLNFQGQDRTFEISRQLDVLRVSGEAFTAECHLLHQEGGSFVLQWADDSGATHHIHAAGATGGDERQLWVDGCTYRYRRVTPRGSGPVADGSLSSTIPAVVADVLVSAGTAVAAGDKLILLESMKMVIPIQAPYDGTVTAIHCAAGDSVPAGTPLLEITKATEA